MAELTENAKDYIECLKDILQRKYLLSGEKALDMITTSYIMESLIDYPEETLHDDKNYLIWIYWYEGIK
mgnify:CR=1 FL=1